MRIWIPPTISVLLAISAAHGVQAQVTDPLPAPVEKQGLTVRIQDVVRLPHTGNYRPADQDRDPGTWSYETCRMDDDSQTIQGDFFIS
jgi:hypothetical protein